MSFMTEYIILYEYSQQGELLVKLKLSYSLPRAQHRVDIEICPSLQLKIEFVGNMYMYSSWYQSLWDERYIFSEHIFIQNIMFRSWRNFAHNQIGCDHCWKYEKELGFLPIAWKIARKLFLALSRNVIKQICGFFRDVNH